MRQWVYLIIALSMLAISCKKESEGNSQSSDQYAPSNYYPLNIGNHFSYNVDSIFYDDFTGTSDTFHFQVREYIADTFVDESNQLNYRLERFYKYDPGTSPIDFSTIDWVLQDVWFITITDFGIQRVEENVRKVNLIKPVLKGVEWDGNAYNSDTRWEYEYTSVNEKYEDYDSCVVVTQLDEENKIEKRYYEQIFAKNIGIVRYHYLDIESQDLSNPAVDIEDRIEKGVQYTQELFDYHIVEPATQISE